MLPKIQFAFMTTGKFAIVQLIQVDIYENLWRHWYNSSRFECSVISCYAHRYRAFVAAWQCFIQYWAHKPLVGTHTIPVICSFITESIDICASSGYQPEISWHTGNNTGVITLFHPLFLPGLVQQYPVFPIDRLVWTFGSGFSLLKHVNTLRKWHWDSWWLNKNINNVKLWMLLSYYYHLGSSRKRNQCWQ